MTEETLPQSLTNPSNGVQYMLITPDNIERAWYLAAPLLEKGQAHLAEHMSFADIYQSLKENRMQLWLVNDAYEVFYMALTELTEYPQKRVLHIIYQGGTRMQEALQFLDCVEHWAWRQGASSVELVARPAMKRVLKPFGYEEPGVYLTKNLRHIKEH